MAGVCGAFLTGDIFNLYVWFEVLLISSYGMLVLGNEKPQLDGAVKYGVLNLIGTNFFLIGTGMIYGVFGTLNMADIAIKMSELDSPASGTLLTIAVLYFLAFAMKAAAFPVNFWLPASYHTPNIVVSAVFAGLLTKVGVYALMRIFVLIMPGSREALADLFALVAILTLMTGAFGALGAKRAPAPARISCDCRDWLHAGGHCSRHHAGAVRSDLLCGSLDHRDDRACIWPAGS
jgi:multicomponent Na+:H+ antiporter subunit D